MPETPDTIIIHDLEVFYRVGVTEVERAAPQRLLLTIEMVHDLAPAAGADDLMKTIDYFAVCQILLRFGDDYFWQLIEALAEDIASMILVEFAPKRVSVEVKKFIIPQAHHVAVRLTRPA